MKRHLVATTALVALVGCADTTTNQQTPYPDLLDSRGNLHYVTDSGAVITGMPIQGDEIAVQFEITKDGETFGMILAETYMEEWADEDHVRIEYDHDNVARYLINGREYNRHHDRIPTFHMAKARANGDVDAPMGIPTDGLRVMQNPLGTELVTELELAGADLVNQNGTCSGEFMAVLAACLRYKCAWGGLANPACIACTGTFLACVAIAMAALGGIL